MNICQERDFQEIANRRKEKAGINATFWRTSISDLLFTYNEQLQIHKLVTSQRTVFIIYIPKTGSPTAILRYRKLIKKLKLLKAVNPIQGHRKQAMTNLEGKYTSGDNAAVRRAEIL